MVWTGDMGRDPRHILYGGPARPRNHGHAWGLGPGGSAGLSLSLGCGEVQGVTPRAPAKHCKGKPEGSTVRHGFSLPEEGGIRSGRCQRAGMPAGVSTGSWRQSVWQRECKSHSPKERMWWR